MFGTPFELNFSDFSIPPTARSNIILVEVISNLYSVEKRMSHINDIIYACGHDANELSCDELLTSFHRYVILYPQVLKKGNVGIYTIISNFMNIPIGFHVRTRWVFLEYHFRFRLRVFSL